MGSPTCEGLNEKYLEILFETVRPILNWLQKNCELFCLCMYDILYFSIKFQKSSKVFRKLSLIPSISHYIPKHQFQIPPHFLIPEKEKKIL
jgi:hypothetical protein